MLPKVIVGDNPDREWFAATRGLEISEGGKKSANIEGGDGGLDLEQKDEVYERTEHAFLQLYKKKGYDAFRETVIQMKRKPESFKEEWALFKGESAEMFLFITISEFIKVHNLPWKVFHSLVIPHWNQKDKTTECDVVLVSETNITVFEAKSYSGNKTLTGLCTITRSSGSADVYSQNALHCRSLSVLIEKHNLKKDAGMKSALFSFSEGDLKDKRNKDAKKLMPALDEDSLLRYLTALTKVNCKYWSADVIGAVEELSTKHTREEHISQFK